MSDVLGSDLYKRVERYEAAVAELHSAHEDVREVLLVDVLFDRWKQLGSDLGFDAQSPPEGRFRAQSGHNLVAAASDNGKVNDAWEH